MCEQKVEQGPAIAMVVVLTEEEIFHSSIKTFWPVTDFWYYTAIRSLYRHMACNAPVSC